MLTRTHGETSTAAFASRLHFRFEGPHERGALCDYSYGPPVSHYARS